MGLCTDVGVGTGNAVGFLPGSNDPSTLSGTLEGPDIRS